MSESADGFELRHWPCLLIIHWISTIQRTSTYFICIKTFHSFDHLRSHCFTEKEIGDEKTLSRASGIGSVAVTGRLVPLHRGAGLDEWWRRDRGVPRTRHSHTGWEILRENSHGKLDVWILMIPSCCHSSCFLVFLFCTRQLMEFVSPKRISIGKKCGTSPRARLLLKLTYCRCLGLMSMMVLRRSEDRDEDEARCPCFGMCLVFRVTQNN